MTAASSSSSVFSELAIARHLSTTVQLSTGDKAQSQLVLFKKVASTFIWLLTCFPERKDLFELGVVPEEGLCDLTFTEPLAKIGKEHDPVL